MDVVEKTILWLQQLSPFGVMVAIFLIAYIENIFPPSPSDVLLVFAGTLIGIGTIGFAPAIITATLGSTLGFMTAYAAGRYFEKEVIEGRFSRWLPVDTFSKVEALFRKYGYGVIIANRFLAGTRAIVSFFAGMSRMNFVPTTLLCALSATVWNVMLLWLGKSLGGNWREAGSYLATYSTFITVILVMIAVVFLVRWFLKKRKAA
ncbi:MAG: DedA family protein [Acidobacteria bacterium]|nr:DedA family protein [Acidobacteriota bacterium]